MIRRLLQSGIRWRIRSEVKHLVETELIAFRQEIDQVKRDSLASTMELHRLVLELQSHLLPAPPKNED